MILMPLVLAAILARRWKASWGLFFVGAAAFIGSQILHIPFNAWVLGPALESLNGSLPGWAITLVTAVALGLSAAVFEEPARYLAIRSREPRQRTWRNAIMIGTGHGGIESILLGILVFYSFLQALALREADLAALGMTAQASELEAYWSAPWYLTLMGALERASTITIQISLTVIVLQVFLRRNWAWLGLAIGIHTLTNAAGLLVLDLWGAYWAEIVILGIALASLGAVFALRTAEPDPPIPGMPPAPGGEPILAPQEPHADQLEDSRYV
jgi:uncharacterized membrane protein YhfC